MQRPFVATPTWKGIHLARAFVLKRHSSSKGIHLERAFILKGHPSCKGIHLERASILQGHPSCKGIHLERASILNEPRSGRALIVQWTSYLRLLPSGTHFHSDTCNAVNAGRRVELESNGFAATAITKSASIGNRPSCDHVISDHVSCDYVSCDHVSCDHTISVTLFKVGARVIYVHLFSPPRVLRLMKEPDLELESAAVRIQMGISRPIAVKAVFFTRLVWRLCDRGNFLSIHAPPKFCNKQRSALFSGIAPLA